MRKMTYAEYVVARLATPPERYPSRVDEWETVMVDGIPMLLRRPSTPVASPQGLYSLFPTLRRS